MNDDMNNAINDAMSNEMNGQTRSPLLFSQYYLECLSHASYLIGDTVNGRAVVVDPQRDIGEYVADAEAAGVTIDAVIETHFHADFVSGHLELARATGARIVYSSVAETEFESVGVADGEHLLLGPVEADPVALEFRHTPGHTPESMSIVVYERASDLDEGRAPYGVLTGDTLFIGDVGRPDLLASIGFTRDELADQLYDSLHDKLMTLPDQTRVFPAHGAGSACGKNLSTELSSTIGVQRSTNYALRAPDKPTFVELVTEGQPPAPGYFVYDAILNRQDRPLLDEETPPAPLGYDSVVSAIDGGALLVDGRTPEEFATGHLEQSINVGLAGRYAEFAGSVLPSDADIVLFTEPGQELEGKNRLGRIGFDRVIGYVSDPYEALITHPDEVGIASRLTAPAFADRLDEVDDIQLVDVRNPGEVAAGTIDGAISIPVGELRSRIGELDPERPTVVFCAGGYRSSVAASLLRQQGFADVSDIIGGYAAWSAEVEGADAY